MQVLIQRFKLNKSIVAIIHLNILEEDGKIENRRGKSRGWIRRREEKRRNTAIISYGTDDRRDFRL